ncbi:RNA pseudouridine synthase [Synechococcus sp. MU1642]|uniref:pseudouridine synthase family protein n=1 Tax=Synechococcus sp. MU1642 TaxID=2508348 RepID=UPI001CF88789|nr:RNA pseudouridine synthase [Synechococcus sp. MU1642]MCB4408024.1 RNA pseudouridine synthase [Synechococcus sp. MU1642]
MKPAALNDGWTYRDKVPRADAGTLVSDWLADRYRHSDRLVWQQRIAAGELDWNGALLTGDLALQEEDTLCWRRPPWLEEAIPDQWETIHDDGDLLVINKPSGLPVMPGGGFLRHTLTALLEPTGARPVHRLGRFTSGLQVCARTPQMRALWSKRFRPAGGCRKVYQAWSHRVPGLELGQCLMVSSDVVERPHPLLGWIWGPEPLDDEPIRKRFSARSELELLERTADGDRLQVTITTGRPHQIRIHLAQLGSPLLGDPLYLRNREITATATPGDGGYRLHAWRLSGLPHLGETTLQVDPPSEGDQALRNSIKREK